MSSGHRNFRDTGGWSVPGRQAPAGAGSASETGTARARRAVSAVPACLLPPVYGARAVGCQTSNTIVVLIEQKGLCEKWFCSKTTSLLGKGTPKLQMAHNAQPRWRTVTHFSSQSTRSAQRLSAKTPRQPLLMNGLLLHTLEAPKNNEKGAKE